MDDKSIYIVEMNRWGSTEDHHYIIGVYSSLRKALEAGIENERFRGGCGKYEPFIIKTRVDSLGANAIVKSVRDAREMLEEMDV